MAARAALLFASFRLDLDDERLWKDGEPVELRRKPFAILRYLAEHPQRLITQEELVRAVWGNVVVGESAVRTQLYDLRQALGEGIVETAVGRGYRFRPLVTVEPMPAASADVPSGVEAVARAPSEPAGPTAPALFVPGASVAPTPVGRGAELNALEALQRRSTAAERQIAFVAGEPGIGKTTLVSAFLAGVAPGAALCARGQCVEQNGHGEPYLPLLEAMRALCDSADGARVIGVLSRRAPTWLVQMPGLLPDEEWQRVSQRTTGATQERMLRELCEALEQLSLERPVVLVLEDLQWSDLSTFNAVALLGQRRQPARLLVIGTVRQAEILRDGHPLNTIYRELVARGHARVIAPGALTISQVAEYLDGRLPAHRLPATLAAVVHGITDGTPLFLVSVIDDLVDLGLIANDAGAWRLRTTVEEVATRRPDSVRQLIDIQIDRLTPVEQRVIEIASTVGATFAVGLVASAQEANPAEVEEVCDRLVRREHCLRAAGAESWPDGTLQTRYAFRHSLYRAVAMERSAPGRRQTWHRRIAERLVAGYAARADEIAGELAVHYEQAHDLPRAVEFYARAADKASARFAGLDAAALYQAGLRLVEKLAPGPERDALELRLLTGLGPHLIEQSHGGEHVARVSARVLALAQATKEAAPPWSAVMGVWLSHFVGPDLRASNQEADRIVALARQRRRPEMIASALVARAMTKYVGGDLEAARTALREAASLYDEILGAGRDDAVRYAANPFNPGTPDYFYIPAVSLLSTMLWVSGYLDQAATAAADGLAQSAFVQTPIAIVVSRLEVARLHWWNREPEPARLAARQTLDAAGPENSFPLWSSEAAAIEQWARAVITREAEALDDLATTAATQRAWGGRGRVMALLLLADACRHMNATARGLAAIEDAWRAAAALDERILLPELRRLQGELLAGTDRAAAAAAFEEAGTLARAMSAKSFELRAAVGLVRLWSGRKEQRAALARLREVHAWFTEGTTARDLREARAALGPGKISVP